MILVTGGAGFIGSHLVDRLSEENGNVIVMDNLMTGSERNLKECWNNITFFKKDIREIDIGILLKEVETIYHLAANTSVTESMRHPSIDADITIRGTLWLLRNTPKLKNIVFTSSCAVYGEPQLFRVDEKHPTEPISNYGVSKLAVEKYLKIYSKNKFNACSLRISNVYGPRQRLKGESGVVPTFMDKAIRRKNLMIYGDGIQTRDFVYVDDVVDAIIKGTGKNGIYNISSFEETFINELAKEIINLFPYKVKVKNIEEREGEIKRMFVNNHLAKEHISWRPKTNLSEGLKRTKNFYGELLK